ncbi:MAG TPA: non-canonical purine NTP pyrophosphatase [Pyrinomonadaceae bacterium]|nr:non-canonical purine NTP pyrophosphatase [Pyrinomonadaceae bacterium]
MTSCRSLELLIATNNQGKVREVQAALESLPLKLRYLSEFPNVSTVLEAGQTYQENAVLKAVGYARQTGVFALADDSGLEVDALDGRPGVFSARFGGEKASDAERIKLLLSELSEHANMNRSARFVCCMALAGWRSAVVLKPGHETRLLTVTEASCEGIIAPAPRGVNGFGFDPVFVPAGYQQTFAQLSGEIKASISHRAQALAEIRTFISRWLTTA